MSTTLHLTSVTQHPLLYTDKPTERYIEWTVTAPAHETETERPPVNLALVIDRSGSMHGEKLEYVKEAALFAICQLTEIDRISVVTYDNRVDVLVPSLLATPGNKQMLERAIRSIRQGGNTHLSGGWMAGCDEVARHLDTAFVNRTLLLTDGLANSGITSQDELAQHARELRVRGLATSTFGVGLGFNEYLLQAMAEAGGGNFHFIESPADIPLIFQKELGDLFQVTARNVSLEIDFPANMTMELIGELEHSVLPGGLNIALGDMMNGENRLLYVKATSQSGVPYQTVEIESKARGMTLDGAPMMVKNTVQFVFQHADQVDQIEVDELMMGRVSEVELAVSAAKAVRYERSGRRNEGRREILDKLRRMQPYTAHSTADAHRRLSRDISDGLSETRRKNVYAESHRNTKFGPRPVENEDWNNQE